MDKAPDAFRTISEVAEELDVPQHVLRFWETRFAQIKPMKRGGGRRYYRPEDVDLLRGIRHLLYGEGYTIRGVQRLLKDNGVKFVQGVWVAENGEPVAGRSESDATAEPEADEAEDSEDTTESVADDEGEEDTAEDPSPRREPVFAAPAEPRPTPPPPRDTRPALQRSNPVAIAPVAPEPSPPAAQPVRVSLSADDRKRLEAALFELGECRRLLDVALKE